MQNIAEDLKMQTIKHQNLQQVYLNGKKATLFEVYSLVNGHWVFDYNDFIFGHYKRGSTILAKRKAFNQK